MKSSSTTLSSAVLPGARNWSPLVMRARDAGRTQIGAEERKTLAAAGRRIEAGAEQRVALIEEAHLRRVAQIHVAEHDAEHDPEAARQRFLVSTGHEE